MARCQAQVPGDDGKLRRCSTGCLDGDGWCEEHHLEYLNKLDAYEKATKDARALDAIIQTMDVDSCHAAEELSAKARIVGTYVACLEKAIQLMEELERTFVVNGMLPFVRGQSRVSS